MSYQDADCTGMHQCFHHAHHLRSSALPSITAGRGLSTHHCALPSPMQISAATAAPLAKKVLGEDFLKNLNATGRVYTETNIPQVTIREQLISASAMNQGYDNITGTIPSASVAMADEALTTCYGSKAYGKCTIHLTAQSSTTTTGPIKCSMPNSCAAQALSSILKRIARKMVQQAIGSVWDLIRRKGTPAIRIGRHHDGWPCVYSFLQTARIDRSKWNTKSLCCTTACIRVRRIRGQSDKRGTSSGIHYGNTYLLQMPNRICMHRP